MRNTFKKILCSLLVIVMCFTAVPFVGFDFTAEAAEYKVGDIIQFGSYPQTEVKEEALVAELNALAPEWEDWTSYGYYSGTDYCGTMVQGDWMRYIDIELNGNKYRGVKFTEYRPRYTYLHSFLSNTNQSTNGYSVNVAYWFKFEPIDWRILDPNSGLVMSETIIDSQAYSNTYYYDSSVSNSLYGYFNDSSYKIYASNYETSSIREWLNNDLYNTAFTDCEKEEINPTMLNNDGLFTLLGTTGYEKLDSNATKDNIFLLSVSEVTNSEFGFDSSGSSYDAARQAQGSEYAQCQGLWVSTSNSYDGNSYWFLRTSSYYSNYCCDIDDSGWSSATYDVSRTTIGIRPAMSINLGSEKEEYETGDIIQFGSYPQTEVEDEALVAELNALAPQWEDWTSYGYYSGTGNYGTMVQGDWMRYTDVTYNGNIYRGVKFTQYRPNYTTCNFFEYTVQQFDNGYKTNTVYWFKFEPVDWRILDPVIGFVMCETIIDAQPYSNTIYENGGGAYGYFNDSSHTNYASDYETSSIRQWLNEDFYNTAFADSEKKKINTTTLNNDGYYTSIGTEGYEKLDSKETEDKIFLLSYDEVINSKFGFSLSYWGDDTARFGQGSDYAKCQGLEVYYDNLGSIYNGNSYWNLRSPGEWSNSCCFVDANGYAGSRFGDIVNTSFGVRPALMLNEWPEISQPEHTCNYISEITKQPTHIEYGEMTYTCEGCGDTYTEKLDRLSEHNLLIDERKANCFDPGYVRYFCECGYEYFDSYTEALGHSYLREVITEPTHLEYGEVAYICERCGDNYREKLDKLEEHTYEEVVTKPTCTEPGYVTYICKCGDSYVGNYTDAPGHVYYSEVTKAPTHLEYGEVTYTCERCGDTYTEKLDRLSEHNLLIDERKANCFDPGYVRYFCECGYEYFDSYTEALGHAYLREVTIEPTHLECGEVTYTCERCGDNYREKLDKLEKHTYEEVVTKSTCTESGYVTYICKCGYSYVGNHTEATGHAYYSEVTKEPTHLEYGEITYTCKNCGDNYSEKLDKIEEHTYEGFITTPSCAEKGYTTYICECGKNYADNYVDATGHADKNADGVCDGCSYDFTEGCDCGCHKSGIAGFFFKLKLIFQKIFKRNAICDCGAKHY